MKERPILFKTAMVQAILAGRKTQTRRIAKDVTFNEKTGFCCKGWAHGIGSSYKETMNHILTSKYGPCLAVGDRLWVRETFGDCGTRLTYKADVDDGAHCMVKRWIPSIHMPRAACRIVLEITGVRVERVIAISDSDAKAEGVEPSLVGADLNHIAHVVAFQDLWQSIYGNWDSHPWVWVIEFKVLTTNGVVPEVAA
ncbi:hypothetical protein EIK76_00255 [Rheinheimera mesophila]|uniref:ASCH domain-containing protein n=1 Tax=Rheinheimera mesophila TaxID=1547515 RepID=A0A3P3QQH3_9GAMM|nr:hypothetical protein [Rheinheimera mesophila]KKL00275.1 hypothetical protein SD53_15890 [Rheinheimera mesophila]RRJ22553.1 hypothetical protein EIK76_00255 [Rheinheimera mesophila]